VGALVSIDLAAAEPIANWSIPSRAFVICWR